MHILLLQPGVGRFLMRVLRHSDIHGMTLISSTGEPGERPQPSLLRTTWGDPL